MDFNSKNYQSVKLKFFFKTNGLLFFFHSAKLNLNQWIRIEQNLKKWKLNYSKVLNGIASKSFKTSIFKNINPIVSNFILLVNPNFKTLEVQFDYMKNLKPFFQLISIKLNDKIYSSSQLKKLDTFSYNKNVFNLYNSLDKHLKKSYLLVKKTNCK